MIVAINKVDTIVGRNDTQQREDKLRQMWKERYPKAGEEFIINNAIIFNSRSFSIATDLLLISALKNMGIQVVVELIKSYLPHVSFILVKQISAMTTTVYRDLDIIQMIS